jgi:long-subunit acyl-CoA synthetase (AMP-forming)
VSGRSLEGALDWAEFLAQGEGVVDRPAVDDLAAVVGTGGTTGRPKGVMLSGTNLETMSA